MTLQKPNVKSGRRRDYDQTTMMKKNFDDESCDYFVALRHLGLAMMLLPHSQRRMIRSATEIPERTTTRLRTDRCGADAAAFDVHDDDDDVAAVEINWTTWTATITPQQPQPSSMTTMIELQLLAIRVCFDYDHHQNVSLFQGNDGVVFCRHHFVVVVVADAF